MGQAELKDVGLASDPEASERTSSRLGNYLRRLREGYGYTLRKVEERAMAMGEPIDNSQLSRFEKGKAVPSFDKLRALARVFNVPVQNFSDVLDLEEYQPDRQAASDYDALLKSGSELLARGENGLAFVSYERAFELAEGLADRAAGVEMAAEARWRMASALRGLGKLLMAERELREVLKEQAKLTPRTRLRTLLQLSYLYRELGDLYLASVLAQESLGLARAEDDRLTQAGVLNTLGNMRHDQGQAEAAVEPYREALAMLEELGGHHEMEASVLTNLGGCLVTLGRHDEGVPLLRRLYRQSTIVDVQCRFRWRPG
jgi:transcriptional regulator with XRE-family HTH domain